jgi:hypothetical protein
MFFNRLIIPVGANMKSVLLAALLPSMLANDTVRDLHAVATACLSASVCSPAAGLLAAAAWAVGTTARTMSAWTSAVACSHRTVLTNK